MKSIAFVALLVLSGCATAQAQSFSCLPAAGYNRAELDALKAAEWTLPDDARRNGLALALTSCLGAADPSLRDGIVFEGMTHWLRAKQLTPETMRTLSNDLEARLFAIDPAGFEQPFAALVLSELVRADRIEPYLDPAIRQRILDSGLRYFTNICDYRGFDEHEGWRHGVAHGADLMLQLALNPAFGRGELTRIRDALATQLAPDSHFYTYGESERIVRAILFMAQRGEFSSEEWREWLVAATAVGEDAYSSQRGLARRHNMMNFLSVLYMQARLSESTADDVLLPGIETALVAMP
jgi:hypothetical protein